MFNKKIQDDDVTVLMPDLPSEDDFKTATMAGNLDPNFDIVYDLTYIHTEEEV